MNLFSKNKELKAAIPITILIVVSLALSIFHSFQILTNTFAIIVQEAQEHPILFAFYLAYCFMPILPVLILAIYVFKFYKKIKTDIVTFVLTLIFAPYLLFSLFMTYIRQ